MANEADNTSNSAGPVVMLLGSGEMSRELALAFQRLGASVVAVDGYADAPAHRVADRHAVVTMNDPTALAAVIDRERPDYVVDPGGVLAVDESQTRTDGVEIFPTPRAISLSQDREGLRRLAADELGLPTAPFWFAGSATELSTIAEHAGFPLTVTPVAGATGDGRSVLLRPEDVQPAWNRAIAVGTATTPNRVMAETVVDVEDEITLLTVRTIGSTGPSVHFCEPIGHRDSDGTLATWQPHRLSPAALDAAKSIAARIVNSLGGRGVFAVELLVRGDEVYFTDVRPQPGDAGLLTLRTQRLSQFDLHARAILGLPVDTIMISPGAAEIGYANGPATAAAKRPDTLAILSETLDVAESDVVLFDRLDETDGSHRLGAAIATAPDVTVARDRAQRTAVSLRRLWQS